MQKRGQITLFIVVGMLILAVLFVGVYVMQSAPAVRPITFPEKNQISTLLTACADNALAEGLEIAGLQGGHVYPPAYPAPLDIGMAILPFLYYDGEKLLPTLPAVEAQLSNYLEQKARQCTDKLKGVDLGEPRATVTLLDDAAHGVLIYPVTINKDGNLITFDDPVIVKQKSSMKRLLESAGIIVDKTAQKPYAINIESISSLSFPVTFYPYETEQKVPETGNKNIAVVELMAENKPSSFTFAMRYGK